MAAVICTSTLGFWTSVCCWTGAGDGAAPLVAGAGAGEGVGAGAEACGAGYGEPGPGTAIAPSNGGEEVPGMVG